jgi:hypothetical protein
MASAANAERSSRIGCLSHDGNEFRNRRWPRDAVDPGGVQPGVHIVHDERRLDA